ncbi:MAG: DNA helicase II [Gammaproteobacteria bacterium]|nr:DNA helicase II [Gammaproteobacteria bacterium]
MQLNSPQHQAVTAPESNLLVIAGAGSGKTRVLVERMAFLMRDQGLSPHALMAVTFTNKAAREMRERLEETLGRSLHTMWVGTFHGLAHRFLRAHWRDAGLIEQFLILDSDDQQRMLKRIIADLQLDDAKFKPRAVAGFINSCKDEGQRPHHLQTGRDYYNDMLIRLYAEYDARCNSQNLVDFGELLLRTFETLQNKSELLRHYQERFRHLLIDEFQDTNTIQYAWIRLLAGSTTHVMAVGDDDQSIYAWRGARIENIHRYESDFVPVTTIRLEQNYRSTDVILKAANAVIANNTGRLGKELWTDQGAGTPIQLYAAFNEQDEARFVANRISQHADQGGLYGEQAILYRSNAQSRVLEDALLRAGIPYRIYGGQRFYERLEIKNALMYLRLIQNRFDDTAFERIINVPPRGIGERTVEQIRETARDEGKGLWDAALQLTRGDGLSGRAKTAVVAFIDLINDLDRKATDLELSDLARDVIDTTGLLALQFLSQASLDAGETQADPDADAVQLMTLHSAKGLEFPRVFLVGAEEELFPHVMSLDSAGGLEEERRLAYVGITRAMQHLIVTYAETRRLNGRDHFGLLSRFIREIPQDCIEEVRLESQISRPFVSSSFGARPVDRPHRHPRFQEYDDGFGEDTGLGIGSRVDHGLFGEGTILAFEGSGPQMKVQVRFDDGSKKWLVLQYAKLVPLG